VYFYLRRIKSALPWQYSREWEADGYRDQFYKTMWQQAAQRAGASFTPVGFGIHEIRRGDAKTRVFDNWCEIDDPITLKIALNKLLVYQLLAQEGLRIPRYESFTLMTLARAVTFLAGAHGPCVVKPADGTSGGVGITTGIRTSSQLARAAVVAAGCGHHLIVEEQAVGSNYRLLYLDGVFLDAVLRNAPSVTGDGRSTVRELVEAANATRLAEGGVLPQLLITIDQDMKNTLAGQGLTLRSVPAKGAHVPLKTVINQGIGKDNAQASHLVCDSIIADGARAARAVGTRLAGIDVITTNPAVPLAESGGVILEVNGTPGYHHHYTRDGIFSLADHVLAKLLGAPTSGEAERAYPDSEPAACGMA
jgi:cyanophycin synthetase